LNTGPPSGNGSSLFTRERENCSREIREWRLIGVAGEFIVDVVTLTAFVEGARPYDVATVSPQVQAGTQDVRAGFERLPGMMEIEVRAPTPGIDAKRGWQRAVLVLEDLEAHVATMPGIHVDHDQVGSGPGGDADICVWVLLPPGADFVWVGGGVAVAVGGARVFTDAA
jgi:hypothetical protein